MYARVNGKDSLVKDQFTGVVINTSDEELQAAKRAKKLALERKLKNEALESRIEKLEQMLASLLKEESE